jgi:hypothetical protein
MCSRRNCLHTRAAFAAATLAEHRGHGGNLEAVSEYTSDRRQLFKITTGGRGPTGASNTRTRRWRISDRSRMKGTSPMEFQLSLTRRQSELPPA